jgi:hypothetical protein
MCVVCGGGGRGHGSEAMVSMRNVVAHRGEEKGGDIHMPTQTNHACSIHAHQNTYTHRMRGHTYVFEARRGIVVGVRVPQAAGAKPHPLVFALPQSDLAHDLVSRHVAFLCERGTETGDTRYEIRTWAC